MKFWTAVLYFERSAGSLPDICPDEIMNWHPLPSRQGTMIGWDICQSNSTSYVKSPNNSSGFMFVSCPSLRAIAP